MGQLKSDSCGRTTPYKVRINALLENIIQLKKPFLLTKNSIIIDYMINAVYDIQIKNKIHLDFI